MLRILSLLTVLIAAPAMAVSLSDYEGLSPDAMRAALGPPELSWPEGDQLFWRYGNGNCALLVLFPADRSLQSSLQFTSEMSDSAQQACLLSLAARPNLRAPVSN